MKRNQFTLMAVTFVSGIIIGVSALGLFSFTGTAKPAGLMPNVTKLSVQDARALFTNYFNNTAPINEVVKGYSFNREQISAINYLMSENPDLSGFRVYMGYDETEGNVGLLVGVNGSGQDVTTTIYKAPGAGTGPCPTICDGGSAIINN